MSRRIKRILLVCSNYDNFFLEEDGRLEEQLATEYDELSLRHPPLPRTPSKWLPEQTDSTS